MSSKVTQRSVTFTNNCNPLQITSKEIDLDKCFNPDEIVIKVQSVSANPIDFLAHQCASKWIVSRTPKTIGRDYAGVIVKRGSNVNRKWQVGDEVNGFFKHLLGERGTFTDYLIIDPSKQQAIAHLSNFDYLNINPKDFNRFDIAASYPLTFGTAYGVLYGQGQKLGPNSRILVNGASTAVSNALIQIAKKQLNIGTVVGICNSKSFDYNKKAGFDHLIAYDKGNTVEGVQRYIDNNLQGEKFDLIFDSVGTSQFFPTINKLLKPIDEGSYYVTVAGKSKINYKAGLLGGIAYFPLKNKLQSYSPWRTFNYAYLWAKPESNFMELAAVMFENKQFTPSLDSRYSLEDFQQAIDKLASNKAKGKIIVTFNKD
ncbi:hypothetical protein MOUN0_O00210 [Monosporozyma unispora]|nr:zinc ion binding [Kazachstania unispora]